MSKQYAHPEVLVSTEWVADHVDDAGVSVIEVDVDTSAYDTGHVPGAVGVNWETELQDQVQRDIVGQGAFEALMGKCGITPETTVIIYGDHSNWFAAYAFWLFKTYGHADVRLMDGGRQKWTEESRTLTTDRPDVTATTYRVSAVDTSVRARIADVLATTNAPRSLVDVRSPDEFSGKLIAPPGMTESAQRGGHIPGAANVPWSTAVNEDGTFKSADDLDAIYCQGAGVDPDGETICYCRIGERSSHTWFVLKYLLGAEKARNYDGSWTEYGSMVGVPIECG